MKKNDDITKSRIDKLLADLKTEKSTQYNRCWNYFFKNLQFSRILYKDKKVDKWEVFLLLWNQVVDQKGKEKACIELIDRFLSGQFMHFSFIDFHKQSALEARQAQKVLAGYEEYSGRMELIPVNPNPILN